jgi:TM2 domain-containing membrane protein YozV/DNA-directed RNA polymerase subunit RPC12/RpoP
MMMAKGGLAVAIEFFCSNCGRQLRVADASAGNQAKCPSCSATVLIPHPPTEPVLVPVGAAVSSSPAARQSGNRIAAGVCGILLGALGIHKFILGFTTPGIIMLLVTVLTCGWGGLVMWPIGLIEGIMYLSKSDEEFYQTYVVEKRSWF